MDKRWRSEEKLAALREGDRFREWESLDDQRTCVLCERKFRGRQVGITVGKGARVELHCPSEKCAGTPREWVLPGTALVGEDPWADASFAAATS
ncbi:MAG TPA: hypothetical protein VGQ82_07570 [Chthoniobacterales bacterium]|nr:hypothetical protein [Chthoniobacterales bacterium]